MCYQYPHELVDDLVSSFKYRNLHTTTRNQQQLKALGQNNKMDKFLSVKVSDTKTGFFIEVIDGVCSVNVCQEGSKEAKKC